ncbi:MAG: helix-turn-helix transcriptional regulator [Bacteroidia bacterium]|nr:helix-turn-helix transcriptional regulator [Bacteroidia bacterium]
MSLTRKHIGSLIKKQRLNKKLTQHELAQMVGTDRQYIWNIENGRVNITLDYLDLIILKLDCKQNDFFIS